MDIFYSSVNESAQGGDEQRGAGILLTYSVAAEIATSLEHLGHHLIVKKGQHDGHHLQPGILKYCNNLAV